MRTAAGDFMADTTSEPDAVVPQPVSAPLTRAAIFLVVTINPDADNRAAARSFCADFAGLVRAVEFRDLEAGLSCVMGIGSDAWDRLFGKPRPADEYGTYFIGYCRTPRVTEQMIENMFIGKPPGNYDRILDFSGAVTGTLFFVPSASFLDALGEDAPEPAAPPAKRTAGPAPSTAAASDGSLGIGSLKGEKGP
jgi:deferrochelatase/peroxidase EfeB